MKRISPLYCVALLAACGIDGSEQARSAASADQHLQGGAPNTESDCPNTINDGKTTLIGCPDEIGIGIPPGDDGVPDDGGRPNEIGIGIPPGDGTNGTPGDDGTACGVVTSENGVAGINDCPTDGSGSSPGDEGTGVPGDGGINEEEPLSCVKILDEQKCLLTLGCNVVRDANGRYLGCADPIGL
jgi:hypothetical protein